MIIQNARTKNNKPFADLGKVSIFQNGQVGYEAHSLSDQQQTILRQFFSCCDLHGALFCIAQCSGAVQTRYSPCFSQLGLE